MSNESFEKLFVFNSKGIFTFRKTRAARREPKICLLSIEEKKADSWYWCRNLVSTFWMRRLEHFQIPDLSAPSPQSRNFWNQQLISLELAARKCSETFTVGRDPYSCLLGGEVEMFNLLVPKFLSSRHTRLDRFQPYEFSGSPPLLRAVFFRIKRRESDEFSSARRQLQLSHSYFLS